MNIFNQKRWLLQFVFIAFLLSAGMSRAADTIMVGTWKTPQTIQPYFYQDFITKHRPVEVRPFTNPGDQKNALLAGSLDFTGTTLVQAILSAARGEPVVVVSSLCMKCSALVVGKKSGILKTGDLKGKRVGYVPGTMHHVLLFDTLARAGLTRKDVQLIRVDFFDMVTALSHGQIDAFLSGEPYPTMALLNGTGRILAYPYFGDSIGTINAGMLTTRDMIRNNPDRIQELVTAHVRATAYLKFHPEAWLRRSRSFGYDAQVLERAAKNIELSWDMDKTFILHTKNLALRMKELGIIERLPDIDALIDIRFVKEAQQSIQHDENPK
ncbi:MAG TPA: NrtA/SsuA/CpmA family ABC transporter substrate-binding protein [Syntrophales bacterium]|nr:NrtA/SsuA/CpmA family ABC transporter substrate-binding protein [Syntrophales bacterium]